jgi:protein-disulfide isomerase
MASGNRSGLLALLAVGIAAGLAGAFYIGKSLNVPAPVVQQAGVTKEEVGDLIREHLLANPELVEEMQQALQIKREAESRQMAQSAINDNRDAIFRAPEDMVLGNPVGDITIVEFFDYNCGFCKRAMDDMMAILEVDENIRFVLKEFPILGPDSMNAHRVSMAFRKLALP